MADSYLADEKSAEACYSGKYFHIKGVVQRIRRDASGRWVVNLNRGDKIDVLCFFDTEAAAGLDKVQQKSEIQVYGRVDGIFVGVIAVNDCKLESPKPHVVP